MASETQTYVGAVCAPQYVNGPATGPSVHVNAVGPADAAFKTLARYDWNDPGYIEVLVYMVPDADHPDAGKRHRLRVWLEPET